MIKIHYAFLCILLFSLSGCYEPGPSYPARPGHPSSNQSYQTGFDRGRQDARNNRSRSPERWLSSLRGVNRNQFIRGYNDGYDNQRPSYGEAQRYFRDGERAGAGDARRGLTRAPRRHHQGVPQRFRTDFNNGYNEGYRSHNQSGNEANHYERRGREAAQRDQRQGLRYQPSRHFGDVPRQFRSDFERGYQNGWRGPRR